jgi:hypothetical protein
MIRGNPRPLRDEHRDRKHRDRDPRREGGRGPPGPGRGPPGRNRDGAAAGQKRGLKVPLLPRMKGMNFRSGKGSILPQFMGGGNDLIGSRRRHKSAAQLTAHFFGMVFLIVIHGGLIIWASTLAISFLYRVDLSSESVKVNEALEVFGEQNTDWLDTAEISSFRRAYFARRETVPWKS